MKPLPHSSAELRTRFHPKLSALGVRLGALGLAVVLNATLASAARAADHTQHAPAPPPPAATPAATPAIAPPAAAAAAAPGSAKDIATQVRQAIGASDGSKQRVMLVVNPKDKGLGFVQVKATERDLPGHTTQRMQVAAHAPVSAPAARARVAAFTGHGAPSMQVAAAGGHEIHWSYDGEGGPQSWGQLKPEFNACSSGKRQSPIHIEEYSTLQGPTESIQFNYQPSSASVVNNGHTIQVNVSGDNSITVRGSTYRLLQFHFHHPSEERVNNKTYSMVAHLVHRNEKGQLAVVGILLDPGVTNALIHKVWTYMPLDSGDTVRMPEDVLNLSDLLPVDQRYYQFMGSLTTPPCTEGVLWMVMKQPVTLSKDQIKLFGQLFPNNARPVQLANGRPIRSGQ